MAVLNKYQNRKMLWESLISIAESVRGPWPVIGDFNTILQYHDQSGGSSNPSWRGAQD